jgi:hypothetical protein
MLSCRHFHPVVTQHLYTNISLTGFAARSFHVALVGRNPRSAMYANAVRRLSYTLGDDTPLLSFPMLSLALTRTVNLKALAISIPVELTPLLKDSLMRAGFIKPVDTMYMDIHKTIVISGPRPIVPHLDAFCPGVSIQLLELIRHRNIRAVSLTNLIGYDQIDYLFDSLTGRGGISCLEDLRIRLRKHVDVSVVVLMIGKVFPTIITLSIEQQEMNPMVCTPSPRLALYLTVSTSDGDSDAY